MVSAEEIAAVEVERSKRTIRGSLPRHASADMLPGMGLAGGLRRLHGVAGGRRGGTVGRSGAVAARRGKKHDLVMDPVSVEETGILGR